MDADEQVRTPAWMRYILISAGVYNLVWGAVVILFPAAMFRFAGMELPRYPQIWQCVGMIVGVYGIGYWIAASDPIRHWPITLVGLLGKVFGPIGFGVALLEGTLPLAFGATIVTNDLIWWIPFAAILYAAFKQHSDHSSSLQTDLLTAMAAAHSHRGASLIELSWQQPTLIVFLRHTGCTFCRETAAQLASKRRDIEARGITLVVVHMSDPLHATQFFAQHGLSSVHRFSDPTCQLYQAFGLGRGSFWQLFGPKVWVRGFIAGVLHGHGIGRLSGDGFRMSGAFLIDRGQIITAFRASSAADQPDYDDLVCAEQPWRNKLSSVDEGAKREFATQF